MILKPLNRLLATEWDNKLSIIDRAHYEAVAEYLKTFFYRNTECQRYSTCSGPCNKALVWVMNEREELAVKAISLWPMKKVWINNLHVHYSEHRLLGSHPPTC